MRTNHPVTQREFEVPDGSIIVSTTDAQGRITHCNHAFVQISGYDYDELIGQPHNLVRHPDMPGEAFRDLWATIGRGRPWTGIVKNRRKDGDHYWVKANVTPILEGGRPVAYMSVRFKATPEEVRQAQALYERLAAQRHGAGATIRLHAGRVRFNGWRDLPGRLHRLSLTQRLGLSMAALVVPTLATIGSLPAATVAGFFAAQTATAFGVLAWFHRSVQRRLDAAERFAYELSSCNLTTDIDDVHPHPLSQLVRALTQIQINLRAVVGDARQEVAGTVASIDEISRGSRDLSVRTQAQSETLLRTTASMQEVAGTIRQTAERAVDMSRESAQAAAVAADGGRAVAAVGTTIEGIEASSRQVAEIVQLIEHIAFRTNVLAINAAVEAAHAGEEGRGFGVVAAEVRTLAQGCASSAKEIRDLVHQSSQRVAEGAQRMASAGDTIDRTLQSVDRVGQQIRQITEATAAQSAGIEQVNQAVAELEQVTRDNMALVEATGGAVMALNKRAEALKRSVQIYRT